MPQSKSQSRMQPRTSRLLPKLFRMLPRSLRSSVRKKHLKRLRADAEHIRTIRSYKKDFSRD